jgi:hypothetical protein
MKWIWIFFIFAVAVDAQSITIGNPQSRTYVDTTAVSFNINDGTNIPQRIWITWEYIGGTHTGIAILDGIGALYRTELTNDETKFQSFNFQTSDPLASGHFDELTKFNGMTWDHADFIPDGIYQVVAEYQRPWSVGGGMVTSAPRPSVRPDTRTLPIRSVTPANNSIVAKDFLLLVRLWEMPAAGSAQIVISNGTSSQTFILQQVLYFALNQINHTIDTTNSTIISTSGEPIYFLNNQYYEITFSYMDTTMVHSHEVQTNIIYTDYDPPVMSIVSPLPNTILSWAFFYRMNLTVWVSKPVENVYVSFYNTDTHEIALSIRMNKGILSLPEFPDLIPIHYVYTTDIHLLDGTVDEILPLGNYTIMAHAIDASGRASEIATAENITCILGNDSCTTNAVYINRVVTETVDRFIYLNETLVETIVQYQNVTVNQTVEVIRDVVTSASCDDHCFSTLYFALMVTGIAIGGMAIGAMSFRLYERYKEGKLSYSGVL